MAPGRLRPEVALHGIKGVAEGACRLRTTDRALSLCGVRARGFDGAIGLLALGAAMGQAGYRL